MLNERKSGVLLHISSLASDYGIGTLGKCAYEFVDFLKKSKQTYWQILPICPTSFGDSPYQSFSSFAGNPYFIDFDLLEQDGLLCKDDYININWGEDESKTDYGLIFKSREKVLRIAQVNFEKNVANDYEVFCCENSYWLEDYCTFMAIKGYYNGKPIQEWDSTIRLARSKAFFNLKDELKNEINYHKTIQYLFFKQWYSLKKYANKNGIEIIGDLPIYVSGDSSDVWVNRKFFSLKQSFQPIEVAGCPPDTFSADGQLWGNPVYDWDAMKDDGYKWWIERLRFSFKVYDVLRIDHFRGFDSFYSIKYGEKTARNGKWKQGPGIEFFNFMRNNLGELPIIAEDLGFLTDSVKKLLKDTKFPGMKILQFAYDSREESDYHPSKYNENCVVYTGTHDNDTNVGWYSTANAEDVLNAKLDLNAESPTELCQKMMESAANSVANTCILTMQDLLFLDSDCRMNVPSTLGTNWKWRMKKDELYSHNAQENLLKITVNSKRV